MKRLSFYSLCVVLFVCTAYLLSGCMLFKLRHDLKEIDNMFFLGGEVTAASKDSNIVIAILRYDRFLPALVNYEVLSKPGSFRFHVAPGQYKIFAYSDKNSNLRYDNEEPAVQTALLSGEAGSRTDTLQLSVPARPYNELVRKINSLKQNADIELPAYKKTPGKIVSLSFEIFDRKNAKIGMWEPIRFVREIPFGIFFLEPYNPKKIPILFVHGVGGTPRDFEQIIGSLDRRHFQPWVAFYPSGLRLNTIARFFDSALSELSSQYKMSKIYIIAHSMGGLVSRALILQDLKRGKRSFVSRFISLSTPWGGHCAAESGIKNSPVVIPVWNDIAPSSQFLKDLFARSISESVSYYLLFSYKGSSGMFQSGNNDGVVSLASELRIEAQNDAKLVRGYDTDHTGILKSPNARKMVNSILAAE